MSLLENSVFLARSKLTWRPLKVEVWGWLSMIDRSISPLSVGTRFQALHGSVGFFLSGRLQTACQANQLSLSKSFRLLKARNCHLLEQAYQIRDLPSPSTLQTQSNRRLLRPGLYLKLLPGSPHKNSQHYHFSFFRLFFYWTRDSSYETSLWINTNSNLIIFQIITSSSEMIYCLATTAPLVLFRRWPCWDIHVDRLRKSYLWPTHTQSRITALLTASLPPPLPQTGR